MTFTRAEDYVRWLVTANMGAKSFLFKEDLLRIAKKENIDVPKSDKVTKKEIYSILLEKLGFEKLLQRINEQKVLGFSPIYYMKAWNISNEELKLLAAAGYVTVAGVEEKKIYSKWVDCPLYDILPYFEMSEADVKSLLEKIYLTD